MGIQEHQEIAHFRGHEMLHKNIAIECLLWSQKWNKVLNKIRMGQHKRR